MRIKPFTCLVLFLALGARAAFAAGVSDPTSLSLRDETKNAIDKGLSFLRKQQKADGSWSSADYPALTALPLRAFLHVPSGEYKAGEPFIDKGFDYIAGCAHPNGAIFKKDELLNYNTSICIMALADANEPKYADIIKAGRRHIIGEQQLLGKDNPLDGGIGYGDDDPHSDLSNMEAALEALAYTKNYRDVSEKSKDLDYRAAIGFIQRCQNLPGVNQEKWASDDPKNKGGFIYYPGFSEAGKMDLGNGKVALRSYGSMSYDGLLSYIYADVKKDDPRVQAVLDWLQKNYTLEENPGLGPQGRFYYYHTLTKALSTTGTGLLTLPGGKTTDWKSDLVQELVKLQKPDGSWANTNGRWLEKDPVLVTSYCVLVLDMVAR